MGKQSKLFERRRNRVRYKIRHSTTHRARLSVFRSGKHIYAQIIDDETRSTLAAASSADAAKNGAVSKTWNRDAAAVVGKLIAERALANGVKQVVFDRGGYLYHGRVKALGDAAREGGLQF
jgi:large subunit ribosomal protein L18